MFNWIINKIAGDYNQRQINKIRPIVNEINKIDSSRDNKTDDQIKNKTIEFKERLAKGQTLESILPEAFATVKQACKRMKGSKHLVKGNEVEWDMVPYDVQLLGGIILHNGKIAEMKTGEGKTLVATLPAYLNALTGKGVHIVTVNDYLASRDAEWMGNLYNRLGLTCGCVTKSTQINKRKLEYEKDITYVENSELGFDYLRDNLTKSIQERNVVWRPLYFAIVDEVDSILIDEARTPLIISQASDEPTEKYGYYSQITKLLKPCKGKKKTSKGLLKELLIDEKEETEKDDGDYYIDEKTKSVSLSSLGIQKLEKLLNVENLYKDLGYGEIHHIENALKSQAVYIKDKDYLISNGEVLIVDEHTGRTMPGRRYSEGLHQAIEAKEGVVIQRESKTLATITYQHFFKQYSKLSGMTGTASTEGEEFEKIYDLEVLTIPTNKETIRNDKADKVFFNQNAKWKSVTEKIKFYNEVGLPILIGTSSINTSEYVSSLLKKINIQHYVLNAKFHEQEAEIVSNAGKQGSVVVATNMAGRGTDIKLDKNLLQNISINYNKWIEKKLKKNDFSGEGPYNLEIKIYSKKEFEITMNGFIDQFKIDENISEKAKLEEIKVDKLNSNIKIEINKNKKTKEDVYCTIIIKPINSDEKIETINTEFYYGLYILGTEKHDSRRIDNQLRGRAGRQGDPGVSEFFVSLDDEIMRKMGGDKIQKIAGLLLSKEQLEEMELTQKQFTNSIIRAQKQMEGWHFSTRKHLFDYDTVINKQRTKIYSKRDSLLKEEYEGEFKSITQEIESFLDNVISKFVYTYTSIKPWNIEEIIENIKQFSGFEFNIQELKKFNDPKGMQEYIIIKLKKIYKDKILSVNNERLNDLLKNSYLTSIDKYWVNHIDDLHYLREQVALYGYAQENPLTKYKHEAYDKFQKLLFNIQLEMLSIIFKTDFGFLENEENRLNQQKQIFGNINKGINIEKILQGVINNISQDDIKKVQEEIAKDKKKNQQQLNDNQIQIIELDGNKGKLLQKDDDFEIIEIGDDEKNNNDLNHKKKKLRPNDLCNCGSGKKYKKCCQNK